MPSLRYVLLSDLEVRGGAGIAAGRLASALAARGHEVHWVCAEADGRAHEWRTERVRFEGPLRVWNTAVSRAPRHVQGYLRSPAAEHILRRMLAELAPDVVNVHNVHGAAWRPTILDAIPPQSRILWTLHDMWSMTGRCAYAYDCRQFVTGCTATCPTPQEYPPLAPALIRSSWLERGAVLRRHRDAIAVAPSRWLAQEAKAGLWRDHDVAVIPYGVPADEYLPVDRSTARQALGIHPEGRIIAVMADDLTDRRKGWRYLEGALRALTFPRLTVLLVGGHAPREPLPNGHVALALGRVDHPHLKRAVLGAADCFVHPAPVDNLPNVVLEALACGVPTVAFAIGGLPDMVRPGTTGFLASEVSAEALAEALRAALAVLPSVEMSQACRRVATTEYAMELQALRYEGLLSGERADVLPA